MINKPPPFKGLNIRIPIVTPIKGRGFINHGSGLSRLLRWYLGRSRKEAGITVRCGAHRKSEKSYEPIANI